MKSKQKSNVIEKEWGGYWKYDFLDFNHLINMYFPNKKIVDELRDILPRLIVKYPSAQYKIDESLSKWYDDEGFVKENILVGNGSSEFIRIFNRQFIKKVTVPVPSFNEYEDVNNQQINYFVLPKSDFRIDADDFITSVNESKSNFAIIINPNNPSGAIREKEELLKIFENLKHLDGIVVDESFIDFTGDRKKYTSQTLVNDFNNLIVLRSLSKEFGVPGLRLGYIVTSNKEIRKKIERFLPIWNVNSIAEWFIDVFPKYKNEYMISIKKMIQEKNNFYDKLKGLSIIKPYETYASFILCKVMDESISSTGLRKRLFSDYNCLVKDCIGKTSLGDRFIRVSVRTYKDNGILIDALSKIEEA